MKPTSYIFLVMSLVLFLGGYFTCGIAETMAASSSTPIFDQTFNDEGDAVYTYNLSGEQNTKLSLTFANVDVRVIGTATESYVMLKNFDVNNYTAALSAGTVKIDGTASFLSSLIDMSDGGLKFKGLRYFLLEKPNPERARSVTVYISELSDLTTVSLTLTNGNVTFENLPNSLDYNVSLSGGNVSFTNVYSRSVANLSVTNGDVSIVNSEISGITVNQDKGNFSYTTADSASSELTSYDLRVEQGTVQYNGVAVNSPYKVTSPAPNSVIRVTMKEGLIRVNDGGDPPATPAQ